MMDQGKTVTCKLTTLIGENDDGFWIRLEARSVDGDGFSGFRNVGPFESFEAAAEAADDLDNMIRELGGVDALRPN